MSVVHGIKNAFEVAGPLIAPTIVVSFLGGAVVVERFICLRRSSKINKDDFLQLRTEIKEKANKMRIYRCIRILVFQKAGMSNSTLSIQMGAITYQPFCNKLYVIYTNYLKKINC